MEEYPNSRHMPFFIVFIPSTIHIHHPEISSLPICFPLLLPMHVRRSDGDDLHCGSGGGADDLLGLRIASVFIILIGSLMGALFPVIAKHSSWIKIPKPLFEYVVLPMKRNEIFMLLFQLRKILWFGCDRT